MNRICPSLLSRLSPVSIQVRWKRREPARKQIWLPRAPSKLYNVTEKVYVPRDEQEQIDHLNFMYEAEMNSISMYCKTHFYLPSRSSGGLTNEEVERRESEHRRLLLENEEENRRISQEREARRALERAQKEKELKEQFDKNQEREILLQEEAEKRVNLELERSKTFITKDKLMEAIEHALANPVHYEYAIDKAGRVITDGKIHPNAFTPSAIPESSECKMLEDKGDIRLKATRKMMEKKIY